MLTVFKNFITNLCILYNTIEDKVAMKLIALNDNYSHLLSIFLFMWFNIFWIFISFFVDLLVLFCLLLSFLIEKKYFLFFKLIVNEILDKFIFFFLLYKFKLIYLIFYNFYSALKYFFNTKTTILNKNSIVEWLIHIDGFFVEIINKKKEMILNKLSV